MATLTLRLFLSALVYLPMLLSNFVLTAKDLTPNPCFICCILSEQQHEFPGGEKALLAFINTNLQWPQIYRDACISGKVILSLVVDEEGCVTDVKILKGATPEFNEEAVRVINTLPRFKPGRYQGKPVKITMHVPVVFVLR